MEECTKPNCDCIEQEIRKKGTEFIKSYPCLKGGSADQEKASRPKEVEQPVQQEGPSVQKYHFGEWVIVNGDPTDERQVVDYDVLNNSYNLDKEGMWNWFDASRVSKVQPSTPIVEEQTVCSINCKCESGEDCDGGSALNLIDLVEQQDRIAEIVEFVKSNLNTREEEVINIISDKYRVALIKNEDRN